MPREKSSNGHTLENNSFFADSLDASTLKILNDLTDQYEQDKKTFNVISDSLEMKKMDAYKTTSRAYSNMVSLGTHTTVAMQKRLPITFGVENEQLIIDVEAQRQRMSDSKAFLSVFKHKLIDSIAVEQIAQYESLTSYLADTHAIIASIEKYKGNFNAGLWNKIVIPAGSNISRLRERADKPFGAAMLHYEFRARKLTEKYQQELKVFLRID